MKKYHYDAFISYRHKELDCFAAEKIQKELERYRIPKRVRKTIAKKRIERVFRDRDELPTSSNLTEDIKHALAESKYLIVVCSPDTPGSKWVQQEIELFLETHSRDHILAVLIAGEPLEAFPESLRVIKEEVTGEDGQKTVVSRSIEPLAADIRGNSQKEMKKKLKTERLRLLASILGCAYDDLKQRHREYVMRQAFLGAGLVCCLALAFAGYALRQSAKVQEQYEKALKEESRYLAEMSGQRLESGDRMGALEHALDALPKEGEESRPLVQDAVYALNNALYSYAHEGNLYFRPDRMLEADSRIRHQAGFSAEFSYYLEIDKLGNAYFYNGKDGTLYWKIKGEAFLKGEFYSDSQAAMITKNEIVYLDLEKKKILHTSALETALDNDEPEFLAHEKYTALIQGEELILYETASDQIAYRKAFTEEDVRLWSLKAFRSDGEALAIEVKGTADNIRESDLLLLTIDTKEEQYIRSANDQVEDVLFLEGDRLAILESREIEKYSSNIASKVRVYDCAGRSNIWVSTEYETHSEYFAAGLFSEQMNENGEKKKILGFYVNDLLVLAEEESGKRFVKTYYSDMVAGIGKYDNERLLVGTADGKIQIQMLNYNVAPVYAGEISNNVENFWYNEKYQMAVQSIRSGNTSVVSMLYEDKNMERIDVDGEAYLVTQIPRKGEEQKPFRVITFKDQPHIAVEDPEEAGKWITIENPYQGDSAPKVHVFEKDGKYLLSYNGRNYFVTIDIGSGKETYQETNGDYDNLTYSNRSDLAAYHDISGFELFRLSDGETVLSFESEALGDAGATVGGIWFSTDDRYLIVSMEKDDTCQLKRFNLKERKWEEDLLPDVEFSRIAQEDVQMGSEKNILAVYAEEKIWVVDIDSKEVLQEIPFLGESERQYAFVNHDQGLILYGDNQKLTIWDMEQEKVTAERKEDFVLLDQFIVDPDGKYFAAAENQGYTEKGVFTARSHIYTLDLEKGEFYPYADVIRGVPCFERNEIMCLDYEDGVYVSPIRSMETLRSQGMKVLY